MLTLTLILASCKYPDPICVKSLLARVSRVPLELKLTFGLSRVSVRVIQARLGDPQLCGTRGGHKEKDNIERITFSPESSVTFRNEGKEHYILIHDNGS